MFGHRINSVAIGWLASLVFLLIGVAVWNGYNVADGSFSLGRGLTGAADLFGGIASFGALAIVLFLLVVAGAFFWYVQGHVYDIHEFGLRLFHLGLALAALIVAALVGTAWVKLPSGAGWLMFGILLFITAFTVLMAWIFRVRVKKVTVVNN